jgi:hypothetical protein
MTPTPPDNAIGAMVVLTAIAIVLVLLTEAFANWIR